MDYKRLNTYVIIGLPESNRVSLLLPPMEEAMFVRFALMLAWMISSASL
jgi:hypothetical protein